MLEQYRIQGRIYLRIVHAECALAQGVGHRELLGRQRPDQVGEGCPVDVGGGERVADQELAAGGALLL